MGPRVQSTERGTFSCHFVIGFLGPHQDVVDVACRKFSFGFAPSCSRTFYLQNLNVGDEVYLQNLCEEASNVRTVSDVSPSGVSSSSITADFPALFSPTLGTAD